MSAKTLPSPPKFVYEFACARGIEPFTEEEEKQQDLSQITVEFDNIRRRTEFKTHTKALSANQKFLLSCYLGLTEISKEWLKSCSALTDQTKMLSASSFFAFRAACRNGHLETAQWLWSACPEETRTEMLCSFDFLAFGEACDSGHLVIAQSLWSVCPEETRTKMLGAGNFFAFSQACGNGHLQTVQWLWPLCKDLHHTELTPQLQFIISCFSKLLDFMITTLEKAEVRASLIEHLRKNPALIHLFSKKFLTKFLEYPDTRDYEKDPERLSQDTIVVTKAAVSESLTFFSRIQASQTTASDLGAAAAEASAP